jgi:hypothetical protein
LALSMFIDSDWLQKLHRANTWITHTMQISNRTHAIAAHATAHATAHAIAAHTL